MGQSERHELSYPLLSGNGQVVFPQQMTPVQRNDDIEIIDLDDPRRDVKPTTWHK